MAVTYGFFNSLNGDRKYNAEQMSDYFRGIVNEGVFQHLDSGLAVTAGTGLTVNVAAGRAIVQNRWMQNDASLELSISAASETYARIDAVVIRLDWSSRAISIAVKTGTPGASPAAPSLTRNSTTYEMALAYVNVAASATSVTVTDKRSDGTVCGWATVAQATSGEVDAMLNAMKTGFDGVTYSSPAAMVQGCDTKLQGNIDGVENKLKKSITFYPAEFTPSVGAYSLVTHALYTHPNYRNMLIKNFGIAAIKVNAISQSNIPIVMFFSGIPSESTYIGYYGNITQSTTYTDEIVIVPDNAVYIAVSSYYSTSAPIKVSIASNKSPKPGDQYTYTIQTGGGYSFVSKTWYADANYKAALLSCSEGDAFCITTVTNGSIHLALAYSGDPSESTFIDNFKANEDNLTVYKDTFIIAPKGCTKMAINGYRSNDLIIKTVEYKYSESDTQTYPISYSVENDNITFSNAYGNDVFSVTFGKGGPNQLPDFLSIMPMGYSRNTDWFAPFVVAAKNNIDGDQQGSYYFTGGNHGYDNTGSTTGNTATGRCTALSYFADGKKLSNGDSGSCSEIDIRWTNRIQAFNTTKANGTGREVLEEIHTLHYDGYEMRCDTVLNPLEDIRIVKWYGYQAYISQAWPTVTYIGGVNRTPFTYSDGIASGNATPNEAICQSSTNQLEIEIDRSFDLGKGDLYEGTEGMFTSGSKIYCYIIAGNDLASGAHYGLRGWYRFRPI